MAVASGRGGPQARHTVRGNADRVLSASRLNAANAVSGCRLLAVIPAVWFITIGRADAAFWLFLAAGLSDAVDGFLAKRFNTRTNFGAYLDPVADKVLLTGVYVALAFQALLAPWLVALVLVRDVLIVAGVMIMHRRNALFRARPLLIGKANTLAQILLAAFVLAHAGELVNVGAAVQVLIYVVATTTVLSGLAYLVQAVRRRPAEEPS